VSRSSLPDGIGRPLIAAGLVAGLCVAGLAVWSVQAPVAGAVLAQGQIAVEGSSKTVQHLEGGIVGEILVADGARVRQGQTLLRLDVTEVRAALAVLRSEQGSLSSRAVRLEAELRSEMPDFDRLAAQGASQVAAVAGERAIYAARMQEQAAERDMLEGTLRRLEARRSAVAAELESVRRQAALADEDADVARALTERGVATRAALREIERGLAALRGAESSLAAQLVEAAATEAEVRLERAGAETRRVSAISEEQAKVVARLSQIEPELAALDARLSRIEVAAPVSGTIVDLSVATVGGVVAPGEPLMRIVPSGATLLVEARVLPADRERLAQGMAAEIRLPGIEIRGQTSITGAVASISADRVAGSGEGGEDHYRVVVALDGPPAGLAPGMPVTVVIPTEARSVVAYLLSPLRDAIARSMREV
jgi:HlyD family type I secretion membrane fusion protein